MKSWKIALSAVLYLSKTFFSLKLFSYFFSLNVLLHIFNLGMFNSQFGVLNRTGDSIRVEHRQCCRENTLLSILFLVLPTWFVLILKIKKIIRIYFKVSNLSYTKTNINWVLQWFDFNYQNICNKNSRTVKVVEHVVQQ